MENSFVTISTNILYGHIVITITNILFTHSDQEAQPWGGLKADISEAFRPTGNGGAGAERPLTENMGWGPQIQNEKKNIHEYGILKSPKGGGY